ncbi:MAG: ATP-binding protein, partial [Pseudomonadota bacterium]|nr:ATP-binding protein [Pseudomonadota bacterium]
NLLSNAAKFTLQGTITLTITRKHMPAEEPHSEWLYIQVEDSGVGISPEQLNKIFEAFSQADNSSTREYGGTGLGLTICDYFCRALGGNIFVSSELGKGSVFTVQLPTVVSQINT